VGLQDLSGVHPGRHAQRVQDDVDRGPVGENGMSSTGRILAMTPCCVAAGQLVAVGDLALLRHVHPDQLVDARRQLVAAVAVEDPDADDLAHLAVRDLQRGVAHSRAFSPKIARAGAPPGSARSRPWA